MRASDELLIRRPAPAGGAILGRLVPGEDLPRLTAALFDAPAWIGAGACALLTHAHLRADATDVERLAEATRQRTRLAAGILKRYVFRLATSVGPRIIKITETRGLGNTLRGFFGGSVGRAEHTAQRRAQALGLAAAETRGFLEWRRGPLLYRSLQLQTPLGAVTTLDRFLADELARHGPAAGAACGQALAHTHAQGFVHLDLKPFHAFVDRVRHDAGGGAQYQLRWLDLGRVAFRVTRRRRLINLYQCLRFVLPPQPELQEAFIRAYCAASGWSEKNPERALWRVRRFLDYKLRTHPNPYP